MVSRDGFSRERFAWLLVATGWSPGVHAAHRESKFVPELDDDHIVRLVRTEAAVHHLCLPSTLSETSFCSGLTWSVVILILTVSRHIVGSGCSMQMSHDKTVSDLLDGEILSVNAQLIPAIEQTVITTSDIEHRFFLCADPRWGSHHSQSMFRLCSGGGLFVCQHRARRAARPGGEWAMAR